MNVNQEWSAADHEAGLALFIDPRFRPRFKAALRRIEPGSTNVSISSSVALLTSTAWTVIPLLAGAWRTARRDA